MRKYFFSALLASSAIEQGMYPKIILKPNKEKPVLAHHPWIFSGAIARVENANAGDTVDVCDSSGRFLARGYYNSQSQIAVRVWTWDDELIDRTFFHRRLQAALATRTMLINHTTTNAYRWVNAESDGMPGLIVDRYADGVVVQCLTLGIEKRKTEIVDCLTGLGANNIYERSDAEVRAKEGLSAWVGVLHGEEPPERIEILENGLKFLVDVKRGHKTGFYLDQRENRKRIAEFLLARSTPRAFETLNVFAYTGGFAVYLCAADPNARVINLDASRDALELARENMRLNQCEDRGGWIEGDAFQILRQYRDRGQSFDAIILDPPKFVHTQAQLNAGLRGYKDINLLAFKLLKPGGWLATFSCSGQVSAAMFQKVVFEAATDAKRDAQIVAKLSQSPDHPILLAFPESEYLKGLLCRVT